MNKIKLNKVFADDSTTTKPYGVESQIVGREQPSTEWFATQEEQESEYRQCLAEISRGEWG